MKVALLLSGQLRTYELCKHNIKGAILDKYDTDVFMSIDKTNTYQWDYLNPTDKTEDTKIKDAIDFYKPCEYYVCESLEEGMMKINTFYINQQSQLRIQICQLTNI